MARRRNLTGQQIIDLKPRAKRYAFPDPQMPGLYIRVTPTGAKSWCVVRFAKGKQEWITIGPTHTWTVDAARKRAQQILRGEAKTETVEEVVSLYVKQHVNNLRSTRSVRISLGEITGAFAGRAFNSIQRSEIATLADDIAERRGKRSAEYFVLAFSAMSRWYAKRSDNYIPPLAPGMASLYHNEAKSRILTDAELRQVWLTAEKRNDNFSTLVRLLLLTAQRLGKVTAMRWDEVRDGVWHIPAEAGEKGTGGELALPEIALAVINGRPRMGFNPYVLSARDGGHLTTGGRVKNLFDNACGVTDWSLHDLRRTARSLMSRAGVQPHIAEKVLGHAVQGVEKIYDRHDYKEPKAQALAALAALITSIVHPELVPSKIVQIPRQAPAA
jgi:integrase